MSPARSNPTGRAGLTADEARRRVESIGSALEQALAAARRGDHQVAADVARKVEDLLSHLKTSPQALGELREELEGLRGLYRALVLSLAQERAALAERLSRLQRGKPALDAYRRNG